jgi:hypothetical protein
MQPGQILEKCESLEIKRKKKIQPDYVELVFYTRDTAAWMKLLSGIFGKAVKPTWQKPNDHDCRLTKQFGGIRIEQTLFMKDFQEYIVLAMVWPWKDKILSSLKIPLIKAVQKV